MNKAIEQMQKVYDSLILYANTAFECEQKSSDPFLNGWHEKSLAYEDAAYILEMRCSIADIKIETKKTDRQLFIDSERFESIKYDCEDARELIN